MDKVLIVVPDITRNAHCRSVLPGLLSRLGKEGVPEADVEIIIATGLHKAHTRSQLEYIAGKGVCGRYRVTSHTQDKGSLVLLGRTPEGIPIVLNKKVKEAGRIITIGLVEPHLYAGYSGGAKTIAIGLAGERTINATHCPSFIDRRGTAIGSIHGNPFQGCLWDIIRGLPVTDSINMVNDENGKLVRIFEGRPEDSFKAAVRFARRLFEKRVSRKFDVVICKVDHPKDANLYQSSRAFNYILNTKKPIVKEGGVVLVCASLKEGFGDGLTEKRFAETMRAIKEPAGFIAQVKRDSCVAGEHRAYMVAKALVKADLGFIGIRARRYTKGMPFIYFADVGSALRQLKKERGEGVSVYIAKHALSLIVSRG